MGVLKPDAAREGHEGRRVERDLDRLPQPRGDHHRLLEPVESDLLDHERPGPGGNSIERHGAVEAGTRVTTSHVYDRGRDRRPLRQVMDTDDERSRGGPTGLRRSL
ncbi:MAG: hypothetical protein HY815_21725 [Candidatus Riflebacteria bacterium]|nr:hypothetical protein [Candidatus Riflebacteria bacterium]